MTEDIPIVFGGGYETAVYDIDFKKTSVETRITVRHDANLTATAIPVIPPKVLGAYFTKKLDATVIPI